MRPDELEDLAVRQAFEESAAASRARRRRNAELRTANRRAAVLAVLVAGGLLLGLDVALGDDGPLGSFAGP